MSTSIPKDPELVKAVKQYHHNRVTRGALWDKGGDLTYFSEVVKRNKDITYAQCSVGSFWVTWRQGVQSLHDEHHPEGILVAMRSEDGQEWKQLTGVCFLTGAKREG